MFLLLSRAGWILSSGIRKMETLFETVAFWTSIFFFCATDPENRFQLKVLMNIDDFLKLFSLLPTLANSFSFCKVAACDLMFKISIWLLDEYKMASLLNGWLWCCFVNCSWGLVDLILLTVERTSRGLKLMTVPMISGPIHHSQSSENSAGNNRWYATMHLRTNKPSNKDTAEWRAHIDYSFLSKSQYQHIAMQVMDFFSWYLITLAMKEFQLMVIYLSQ